MLALAPIFQMQLLLFAHASWLFFLHSGSISCLVPVLSVEERILSGADAFKRAWHKEVPSVEGMEAQGSYIKYFFLLLCSVLGFSQGKLWDREKWKFSHFLLCKFGYGKTLGNENQVMKMFHSYSYHPQVVSKLPFPLWTIKSADYKRISSLTGSLGIARLVNLQHLPGWLKG